MSRIELRIADSLSGEDWRSLTTWREHVFSPEGIGTDWVGGNLHIRASSDGVAIGHIGFGTFTLIIDKVETPCIGVGGVVVVPEYQGQRLPMRMFELLREWRDQKDSNLPLVLCCPKNLLKYYHYHNFKQIVNDVYYLQRGSYEKSKFEWMSDKPLSVKESIYIPSNPW
ncbi:MAG: hypothetical protein AB3N14_09840 [Flavobacteriaceae bacterium]